MNNDEKHTVSILNGDNFTIEGILNRESNRGIVVFENLKMIANPD